MMSAGAGVGVLAAGYVKPTLRSVGVVGAYAQLSGPPSLQDGTQGCTPGFWGNEGSNQRAGGKNLWDQPNDPDWLAARLPNGDTFNPFHWNSLFTDVFASHPDVVGKVMYVPGSQTDGVVDDGGGSRAEQAARHLVAAYLNVAIGLSFGYTRNQLKALWADAVAKNTDAAFEALKTELDTENNRHNNTVCGDSSNSLRSPGTVDTWSSGTSTNLVKKKTKP